jgi:TatA/E family protein of Tat protein translocase
MLALFNLGGGEIFLMLAGALLFFGGKKLPELAKGLGNGIKEFKKATGTPAFWCTMSAVGVGFKIPTKVATTNTSAAKPELQCIIVPSSLRTTAAPAPT